MWRLWNVVEIDPDRLLTKLIEEAITTVFRIAAAVIAGTILYFVWR